jgi:hypothetical protein
LVTPASSSLLYIADRGWVTILALSRQGNGLRAPVVSACPQLRRLLDEALSDAGVE